jgi:hypothetical protein
MSEKTFQDYLDSYKETLLKIIPIFYQGNLPFFDSKHIEKRIKEIKDSLNTCNSKKETKKLRKHLFSSEVELEQVKRWEKERPVILKKLQIVIKELDTVVKKHSKPRFRYKFFAPDYKDKDNPLFKGNTKSMAEAILTNFNSYLGSLRLKGKEQNEAIDEIIYKMNTQAKKYLNEYWGAREPISIKTEQMEVKDTAHISIPAGTKWPDVKMVINYGKRKPIDILIKGKRNSKIYFEDIGFKYKKTDKAISAMNTFKKFVESENNTVLSKNVKFHHRKTLKDKLCHHFGISEDPFLFIKNEKAYKTLFSIEYKHYTNYPSV